MSESSAPSIAEGVRSGLNLIVSVAETPNGEVSIDNLAHALSRIPGLHEGLDLYERHLLEAARDHGESWASLASRLGRGSEQAMQQRYRRLGGTRSWRGTARTTRAADLHLLRDAVAAANAAYTSTADWFRAQLALRRVIGTVLSGDALTALDVQAATGCSDYTLVLARDTDPTVDMAIDADTDERLAKLLAVENWLDDTWLASPPKPGTLAERDQHPATPTPVTAWHRLAPRERNRYRAEANQQLSLPAPPPHHPWVFRWRHWYRLLAEQVVVAEYKSESGYWALFTQTTNSEPGEYVGEEMGRELQELTSAGLTILCRDGAPVTDYKLP